MISTQVDAAQADVNAIVERFSSAEAAQRTVRVAVELANGLKMDVDIRKHRVVVDEPKGLGGTDEGPNPVEVLLTSLVTCQAITYRVWAAKLGVALDRVRIDSEGDIDLRGFFGVDESVRAGFSGVRLHVTFEGPETPDRYRELADTVDSHCPVLDFSANPIPVERTIA